MSVNTTPLFPGKIQHAQTLLNTANTNRDGTGTMFDIALANFGDATNGAIVERVSGLIAGAIGTPNSANIIRAWGKLSSVYRLLGEFTVPVVTPTAAVPGAVMTNGASQGSAANPYIQVNWKLAPNEQLSFSIHAYAGTQDQAHINVEGGAYSNS